MLGGVLLQHVCVFFCQDANWHNPAEKILSCISTIFPLYPSKQSRSSVYCHQGKTPCPFSLDLQVGARQQQEGTALHGCLHSCLDATRKLGIQVLGELTHPSPRMLYSCSFLMASKWKMQHLVCPRQIFLGSSQAVLGPPSPVFPPAFPWLYKLLFLIQTL